jgi:hypothetical protein
MTASQSVAPLPIELWDSIIRFSDPYAGLRGDADYPWIDSQQRWRHDKQLYRQRSLTINSLSQVCRTWRELSGPVRNQYLHITRGGRSNLSLLLEEYGQKPNFFKETYRIRIHFPIKEDISALITFVRGIGSLTALELNIDDGPDISDVYKFLREHLPAILNSTPSLIRLDLEHPSTFEYDVNAVLSTDMVGRMSDAGNHLRHLSCSIEVSFPYNLGNAPSFPYLEILRVAVDCDWQVPSPQIAHAWFSCWKLPSLRQLSLVGVTHWSAWKMVLALLTPNLEFFDIGVRGYYEVHVLVLTTRSHSG